MKVTRIKTYLLGPQDSTDGWSTVKPFLFVKIETDKDLVAWGEAYALSGRERGIQEFIASLGQTLVGKAAPGPRAFRQNAVIGFADKRTGIDFFCAMSALETALWDLKGKALGAPVHALLGGAIREQVPIYVNTWSDRGPSQTQVVERAIALRDSGFNAIKIYPMQFDGLKNAADFVERARTALGPDTDIMIDLNALDDPHLALQAAGRFASHDPFWFEEPVTSDDLGSLREFRSKTKLRIVSGERHGGSHKFRDMLEQRAADVLNPDIAGCGGILEILDIAAMAAPYSVLVSPHNYNSTTVAMAAMLHAAAAMPNLLTAELYPDYSGVGEAFAETDFEIADGFASLPQSPGLGVKMDETVLEAQAINRTFSS